MKTGIKLGLFYECTTPKQQSPEIYASGLDEQNIVCARINVAEKLSAFGKNLRFNKVVIMVVQPNEVHTFI